MSLNQSTRLSRLDPLHCEVHDWLDEEAELLERRDLLQWLPMLHPEIHYEIPVRQTMLNEDGDGLSPRHSHMRENYESLAFRVERFQHPGAWSENPASRTRRLVSNVKVFEPRSVNEVEAHSSLLLLRSRNDDPDYEILSGRRRDVFRRDDGGPLRLVNRVVALDQTLLNIVNMAIFL